MTIKRVLLSSTYRGAGGSGGGHAPRQEIHQEDFYRAEIPAFSSHTHAFVASPQDYDCTVKTEKKTMKTGHNPLPIFIRVGSGDGAHDSQKIRGLLSLEPHSLHTLAISGGRGDRPSTLPSYVRPDEDCTIF